jgi:hypothetical protein
VVCLGRWLLEEALREGTLHVEELDEEGRVSELRFINTGTKTVLILEGDESIGTKQNRTGELQRTLRRRLADRLACLLHRAGALELPLSSVLFRKQKPSSLSGSSSHRACPTPRSEVGATLATRAPFRRRSTTRLVSTLFHPLHARCRIRGPISLRRSPPSRSSRTCSPRHLRRCRRARRARCW